ncbi:hypothetical protein AAFF_G00230420 [Aldrovandia affinis]|uniref:Uncharacterized protein n=1 Tax=Aldrovandia affinis TaxID=143900 RepID=A0AAD7W469_9TELE|nr:hypothetical protein AAFF_G00230420 [Aldrovandia affinis]
MPPGRPENCAPQTMSLSIPPPSSPLRSAHLKVLLSHPSRVEEHERKRRIDRPPPRLQKPNSGAAAILTFAFAERSFLLDQTVWNLAEFQEKVSVDTSWVATVIAPAACCLNLRPDEPP